MGSGILNFEELRTICAWRQKELLNVCFLRAFCQKLLC